MLSSKTSNVVCKPRENKVSLCENGHAESNELLRHEGVRSLLSTGLSLTCLHQTLSSQFSCVTDVHNLPSLSVSTRVILHLSHSPYHLNSYTKQTIIIQSKCRFTLQNVHSSLISQCCNFSSSPTTAMH